jgi:cytochrome c556
MRRLVCGASVLALLLLAALATSPAGAGDEPTPTIKDVMRKLHKGANSPLARLKKDLGAPAPNWKAVQDTTKDFVILGAALGKNDPPRGEAAGYKKLADAYFTNAKALDDAAKAEDKAAAQAAYRKLSASCKSCHQAHRGM